MSYLGLSRRIARLLLTQTGTGVPEEVLAYAVEVLLLNVLNVTVALVLAAWARVLIETIFCLGTVAILRFFAGGAHNASPARCTLVTGLVFPLLGTAARRMVGFSPTLIGWLPVVAFILGLISMLAFAPVDSPVAPIISGERRKRLKAGAIISTVLLAAVAFALKNSVLRASISLGILWSAFILTPIGQELFRLIDSLNWSWRGGVSA